MKNKLLLNTSVLSILCLGGAAQAATVYSFANLSSASPSTANTPGTVSGTIQTPTGSVSLTYTGDVSTYTQVKNTGADFYTSWPTVYENPTVANTPPVTDTIALDEKYQRTGTLTFSSAIVNPILDIVSLGSPGVAVSYVFSTAPQILSQGAAYWGGCSTCLSVSGDTLTGAEGSGVVLLSGTFSNISFTEVGTDDLWDGFTVGVAGIASGGGTPSSAPEPATWGIMLAAGLGLLLFRKLRPSLQR